MNSTFSDVTSKFLLVNFDDILVSSKHQSKHLEYIKAALQYLRYKWFKTKSSTCKFAVDIIKYLGHIVNKGKVSVDPDIIDTIHSWPSLMCVKEVQQFLGLANYYYQFKKQFTQIASLFTRLLQKGIDFVWSSECKSAFQLLKDKLCLDLVLHLPDFQ